MVQNNKGGRDERAIIATIAVPAASLLLCVVGFFAVRALDSVESRLATTERLIHTNEIEIAKLQWLCASKAVIPVAPLPGPGQ